MPQSPITTMGAQNHPPSRQPLKVYLDTNILINLGQARYQPPKNQRTGSQRALAAVQQSTQSGVAIFPLSATHVIEISKHSNEERRRRLGQVLIEVSRGWAFANRKELLREELRSAIARVTNRRRPPACTPMFARFGIPFTFGLHEAFIDELGALPDQTLMRLASLGMDEALAFFLDGASDATARLAMGKIMDSERHQAAHDERARQLLSKYGADMERRAYSARLIEDCIDEIILALDEFGIDLFQLMRQFPEMARSIFDGVPQFEVETELFIRRNAHRDRKVNRTDMMDLAHLTLAIPYCDVVVTEAFWVTLTKQAGLDAKYSVTMLSDLDDLSDHLESLT